MVGVDKFFNKIKAWYYGPEKAAAKLGLQPTAFHGGSTADRYYGGSSGGEKYPFGMSGQGQGLFLNHHLVRQNARLAMQDSPQGRATIERKVDAIAHTGLKLEPTPDAAILGITQQEATKWAKITASRFDLWAQDKKQHRSETMTFYQAQWLHAYFKERDNDVFVRLYYSPDKDLQNPLQFEFIDADQIRGFAFTSSYGFQQNEDGIIRDERGRETGYKIWVKQKDGTYKDVEVKAKGPKSGRIFMLHGFSVEYAGQGRGFSKLAPVLQDLQNFTDFSMAHIKQAINQAQIVGWITPADDEDAQPIFDETLTENGAGPAAKKFSSETTEDTTEEATISDFTCYDLPEATSSIPGSTFIQSLTKGANITLANPNAPSTGYDRFRTAFLTSLSACSGTPQEVVDMTFGNSFSASRATLLLFQRVVEIGQQDQNSDFNNPIYEMWLSGEIAAGRTVAPGWSDPIIRKAWMKATWRGVPVPDIDPAKLAKARRENIELGTTSAERESQLNSGKSAADNIAANNQSYADYEPLPFSKAAEKAEPKDDDDDDENKKEK